MPEQPPHSVGKADQFWLVRDLARHALWLFLIVLWLTYGLCVAWREKRISIAVFPIVLIAFLLRQYIPEKIRRIQCPAYYTAFGLLATIPIALMLTSAISIEYVRDYDVYLKLGKSLYAGGAYIDTLGELAWRPPGMAFLYGFPLFMGVSEQWTVFTINSGICLIIFYCIKAFLGRAAIAEVWSTVIPGASLICLATAPLLLLPIAHIPSIASMLLILVLIPTSAQGLAEFPLSRWFIAGVLTGISALFRPNLVLEFPIFVAALLTAGRSLRSVRFRKIGIAVVACTIGVASVIAPWTIRNWIVLHRVVPLSTNGGYVFYSGNSSADPHQQGLYTASVYDELNREFSNEVERDKMGWRRGLFNIQNHPIAFLKSFQYRFSRLLGHQTFTVDYIRETGQSNSFWMSSLVIPEIAWLALFWSFWVQMFLSRRSIRNRLFDKKRILWPECSLFVVVVISSLFEISKTYQLSLLPFLLYLWLDRRGQTATKDNG